MNERVEWSEDEIKALLHFVHIPSSGTMDNRLSYATREMTSAKVNFPIRPMFECRKKYYEYINKPQIINKSKNTMTAKEAKQKAEEALFNVTDSQYSKIIKEIGIAANKGEFKVVVYETMHPFVIERLKTDGYHVRVYSNDPRGENSTTIEWSNIIEFSE